MWKQYDEYFAKLPRNPPREDQIVAKIGHQTVTTVGQLNSLGPNKWLKGTILSAYLDLMGKEVYVHNEEDKNPPKMAVFDNLFLDTTTDIDKYNYQKGRASALKRLRGRCPSDFEVVLFFLQQRSAPLYQFGFLPQTTAHLRARFVW
jgi:hypothetical protein